MEPEIGIMGPESGGGGGGGGGGGKAAAASRHSSTVPPTVQNHVPLRVPKIRRHALTSPRQTQRHAQTKTPDTASSMARHLCIACPWLRLESENAGTILSRNRELPEGDGAR
ncbi:hypothetical protein CERZMDRAFT_80993 [Cercospora zeae-maydis SCOH1-5]|uniref:Uncharacterized protein n=1 Tax=Cercospora zeae-maydis SCOH1-5 TaxID=717836 RepID=A0A6A6FUA3_9PEZI|nr:hypothetical protein CERZMDRAFT_80993 [Cercospora zeae-maydis SCOH1-5]